MSESARRHEACVLAIREQVAQHMAGFDELRARSRERPLTFIERTATERSLQILIGAAISCSRHLLRALGKPVPTEARAAIECAYEITALTEPAAAEMRGAVGMRNAIIHDCPNLDCPLLERVLAEGRYSRVERYLMFVSERLLDAGGSEGR